MAIFKSMSLGVRASWSLGVRVSGSRNIKPNEQTIVLNKLTPDIEEADGFFKAVDIFQLKAVIYCVNYLAQKIPTEFLEWR